MIQPTAQETADMACEILRQTRDSALLAPVDLKILEMAVNGELNEEGVKYFQQLHTEIVAGRYNHLKKYLHGVEYITKDHQGYVYFKGQHVDHYSFRDWREEQFEARRLARVCLALEANGIPVSIATASFEVSNHLTPDELQALGYFDQYTREV